MPLSEETGEGDKKSLACFPLLCTWVLCMEGCTPGCFLFAFGKFTLPEGYFRYAVDGFALCYENKARSQELNLDNKCFQQSWKHHNKAVVKLAAVSEILLMQRIRFVLPHGSHASLIPVCTGKAVFVHSFYVWLQNRIHRKECLALAWCK